MYIYAFSKFKKDYLLLLNRTQQLQRKLYKFNNKNYLKHYKYSNILLFQ